MMMGDVERAQERWALILQYLTSQRQIFTPPIQLCHPLLSFSRLYAVFSVNPSTLCPFSELFTPLRCVFESIPHLCAPLLSFSRLYAVFLSQPFNWLEGGMEVD